jgi:hypothetical protein
VEAFSERYFALPTAVGRITGGTFDHLGERTQGELQGGCENMVSICACREVFRKVVIHTNIQYVLFTFDKTKFADNWLLIWSDIGGAVRLIIDLYTGFHGRRS